MATQTGVTTTGTTLDDILYGKADRDRLYGLIGDDALYGLGGDDQLFGAAGDDRLDGGVGADRMEGGSGNDTYVVDDAGDVVVDTGGTDTVETVLDAYVLGSAIENLRYVGTGSFAGTGNNLANVLQGGAGDDVLNGGGGADRLAGGAGDDRYIVDTIADQVVEAAGEGFDTVSSGVSYTLGAGVAVERLEAKAGSSSIRLTGNALAQEIVGNNGANTLDGGGGADTMRGGLGNDTYHVDDGGDVVDEAADAGTDTVYASVDFTLGSHVENLTLVGARGLAGTGNDLANRIAGGDGRDVIDGAAGADTLYGGGDDDTLYGSAGRDRLSGDAGADVLRGGADADKLYGGEGGDALYGDDGADVLEGGDGDDLLAGGAGSDGLRGGAGADRFVVAAADGTATDTVDDLNFVEGDRLVLAGGGRGEVAIAGYAELVAFVATTSGATVVRRDAAGAALLSLDAGNGAKQLVVITDKSGGATAWAQYEAAVAANKAPVTVADTAAVAQGGTVLVDVIGNDGDDAPGITLVSATSVAGGGIVGVEDGQVRFATDDSFRHLRVGQSETVAIDYLAADASGQQATGRLTVVVTGTNDGPVIASGDTGGTVVAGGGATATGRLLATDADDGATATWSGSAAGTYGRFAIDAATGAWTYAPDDTLPATHALAAGASATETFTATVTDDAGATASRVVTVVVRGANDAATFGGIATGTVTEDTLSSAAGLLSVFDIDGDVAGFRAADALVGDHGRLSIDVLGTWEYTLADDDAAVQALGQGATATDTITVYSADGTPTQVAITIFGTNDRATIGGDVVGRATEDAGQAVTGQLLIADADAGETAFRAFTGGWGSYGQLSLTAGGAWRYLLDNGRADVQALGTGQTLVDRMTVHSVDGTTRLIEVTVTGTNDAPVVTGVLTGDVTEDAVTSAAGVLAVADVDAGQSGFRAETLAGAHGSLRIDAAGAWTYTLANDGAAVQAMRGGETATDTITVYSTDGTPTDVVVTVHGTGDRATIGGDVVGRATEDAGQAVTGQLTIVDTDAGEAAFQAFTGGWGSYGQLSLTAGGAWTYLLDSSRADVQALGAGQTLLDRMTVHSVEGSPRLIEVVVTGVNDAAVIGGATTATAIATTTLPVTGVLTASDADAGQSGFQAGTVAGTYGSLRIDGAGAWAYTLAGDTAAVRALDRTQSVTDTVAVRSLDGTVGIVAVTIRGVNDAPVVTRTVADQRILEDGSWSFALPVDMFGDVDRDVLNLSATLGNGGALPSWLVFDAATRTFRGTPPADYNTEVNGTGPIELRVTASDGVLLAQDSFTLTITPTVDATRLVIPLPDRVGTEEVPFSFAMPAGSFVDPDGPLSYSAKLKDGSALPGWVQMDGKTGLLTGHAPVNYTGSLTVVVTAKDANSSVQDEFNLLIANVNDRPTVKAAIPDQVRAEDSGLWEYTVPTGTFADVDSASLKLSATMANGTALPSWLTFNATSGKFSGTPPKDYNGDLALLVKASDGALDVSTGFTFKVTPVNDAPVARQDVIRMTRGETADFEESFLLLNDTDVDGDTLTVTRVYHDATSGVTVASFFPGTFSVKVNPEFGSRYGRLNYDISDGHGGTHSWSIVVDLGTTGNRAVSDEESALSVAPDAGAFETGAQDGGDSFALLHIGHASSSDLLLTDLLAI